MDFSWNNQERGQRIEDFIHDTTRKDPLLMREVYKMGLGALQEWTDTGVVVGASCGCLVGTCAIAAARLGRVDATAIDSCGAISVVPMTLAAAIARGNVTRARQIEEIGIEVADECDIDSYLWDDDDDGLKYREREAAVRSYLEDLIATDLRLLGLRVPARRELVLDV